MKSAPNEFVGFTGCRYQFKELLQERQHVARVWLATSERDRFILKDIPKNIFSNLNEQVRPQLHESPYIRLPWDAIPNQRILVYNYLTDYFLSLLRKGLSMRARKQILKKGLLGIAELHDRQIIHLDIKPDNIMVDCHRSAQETVIERVQIIDLENAAYLPRGRCIKGMLAGNDNWRSPEAHFKGELTKPTDIFSFGIVGALPAFIRLQRQVSYPGDPEGVNGLLKHISDDEISCQILQMLWEGRSEEYLQYKLLTEWPDVVESSFKDLIRRLTNLDPMKRITEPQALEHPWLADA